MDKTAKVVAPSVCQCGHTGGGEGSDHAGAYPVAGHGRCLVPGCSCTKFTWARFTDEFKASRGMTE